MSDYENEKNQRARDDGSYSFDETGTCSDISSSDSVTPYRKSFNLKEYEKREETEYAEFVQNYEQDLCDRYIETMSMRRKKMALRNISVLDTLYPKNFIQRQNPLCTTQEVKEERQLPFTWKSIEPTVVNVVADLDVKATNAQAVAVNVNETNGTETNDTKMNGTETNCDKKSRKKSRENTQKKAGEVVEKDVSDEEMMKAMTRHSAQSPRSSPRQVVVEKRNHERIGNEIGQERIRIFTKPSTPSQSNQQHVQSPSTSSPKSSPISNKSRMCNFKNCHRPGCGYAHSMAEFTPVPCKFQDCKRSNCRFYHSTKETKQEYLVRFRSALNA